MRTTTIISIVAIQSLFIPKTLKVPLQRNFRILFYSPKRTYDAELYFVKSYREVVFFAAEIALMEQNHVRAVDPSLRTL